MMSDEGTNTGRYVLSNAIQKALKGREEENPPWTKSGLVFRRSTSNSAAGAL
jgi:hypothetical protein